MARARARCAVEAVLLESLTKRGFAPEDRVAVAYSGGPDSTALLVALKSIGWRDIVAIHVDHGIRPRSELDEERVLVEEACTDLGVRLVVARLRPGAVEARARETGQGIEAEARRFRRIALRTAANRSGALAILLAHTLDDQAETLLMRLCGGSGAGGLRGIPAESGSLLRPFLGIRKTELVGYLAQRGRRYSVDSTNASGQYLRNRVRRSLVPVLDSTFPGWRLGLARVQAKAALDEEALGTEAESLGFRADSDGCMRCRAAKLLGAPEAVAIRAIVRAIGAILGQERVPFGLAVAALRALKSDGRRAYRGRGVELRLLGDDAVISSKNAAMGRGGLDFPPRGGYFVSIERPCQVRVGKLDVRALWSVPSELPGDGSGIREDAFSFPLVVRSRRPGDALALRKGSKRLDELLSEWGILARLRDKVPIVEDRYGIVAVLGEGIGGKVRYRALREGDRPRGGSSNGEARVLSVIVKGA